MNKWNLFYFMSTKRKKYYKNVNSPRANLKFNAFSIKSQQSFYRICQIDYKIHLRS